MEYYIPIGAAVVTGAIASYTDLKFARIPNKLTLSAAALGFIINFIFKGTSGLLFSAAGLAAGLGLLLIPYLLGGIGGGDVKLLAATGAIGGAKFVFFTTLFGALAGGVLALVILRLPLLCFGGPLSLGSLNLAKVDQKTGRVCIP